MWNYFIEKYFSQKYKNLKMDYITDANFVERNIDFEL